MSNLVVKINRNVDFSLPGDTEQEQAIVSNEFSSILAPAIRRAWMLAHSLGHGQVLVEHFITALFTEEDSRRILERNGYSDDDGERGQKLTKRRSGFGAPTFDQSAVSPGKLLASPHLDAWFHAARHVARTREKEHVTLVVDDFIRALDPRFLSDDRELAAETAGALEFVRGKLCRQEGTQPKPFKTQVIEKMDEVLKELRGEASAANGARTTAMDLLTAGLNQIGAKVDGINPTISSAKSEIGASIYAANATRTNEIELLAARLRQLEEKVDELTPGMPVIGPEIEENISAVRAEMQKGTARLSTIEHYIAVGQNNVTMQFKAIQESLALAQAITDKKLSAMASELSRDSGFGRTLSGMLPVMAIVAGAGIGLIARIAFGPL